MYYTIIETWNDGHDHADVIFVTCNLVDALKEFSSRREKCLEPSWCASKFSLYEWTDEKTSRIIDECDNYDKTIII